MSNQQPNLPPNLQAALNEFYAAPQPDHAFAERLEMRLRQRQLERSLRTNRDSAKGWRTMKHTFHTRPLLAVIAAILALLLMTGLAYAVGRLTGFIPGVGFVKDVQSVLATPVVIERLLALTPTVELAQNQTPSAGNETTTSTPIIEQAPSNNPTALPVFERKGITITVEQVVAEADRLVIAYQITGLPPDLFSPERVPTLQAYAEAHPDEPIPQQVRLPDGTLLEHADGGHCEGTSWLSCQSNYAPLPKNVNRFTLEIRRLENALPGELPEDWAIPIDLTAVSPSASGLQEPDLRSQPVNGITLRLLKVSQEPDQTAFQLGLDWDGQNRMPHHMPAITLQDDQGRTYTLTSGPEGDQFSPDHPNSMTFSSLVTDAVDRSIRLTFQLDWVMMSAFGQASFHLDPGSAAQVGQEWKIDQTLQAGGFDLHLTQARLKSIHDGAVTYEFDLQAPAEVIAIHLFSRDAALTDCEYDATHGLMVCRVTLPALPTQPFELRLKEILYEVNGPWEIIWQPQ